MQENPGIKLYSRLIIEHQGRKFTETEILEILRQALNQLSQIHFQGLAHGAISSDTLAQNQSNLQTVLLNNPGFANPSYTAPEQLQTGQISTSGDIYALGVTMIVLLTGKNPELLRNYNGSWNWHDDCFVSDQLSGILEQAIAVYPRYRFSDAMQMLSAINSVFTPVTPTINTTLDNQSNNLLNYKSTYPVANPYAKNHNLRGLQLYLISGGITILISLTGFGLIKFITEKENLKTSHIANSRNSVNQKSSSSKEQIQTTNQETSNPTNIISANPNRQPVTPNTIETFKSTPNSSNQTYNNQLNSHHFNSFYFISDAAFANYSKASEYVESLKSLGYPQAGMFWIPDYPNLSGKSLFTVYPARFDNRQSCRNFLRQYAQNKPEAYCAFASKDKNASPDRFYSRW